MKCSFASGKILDTKLRGESKIIDKLKNDGKVIDTKLKR